MSNDEELVGVMRGLALIALVKLVRQSPTGFVTLTEDDFAAVDGLADTDKWMLEKASCL